MVVKYDDAQVTTLGNGCIQKIHAHSRKLMLAKFQFQNGAIGAIHRHPHEQTGYIPYESFQFEIDGVTHVSKKGDSYYVPSDALHGVTALENAAALDTFTPRRDDFINK